MSGLIDISDERFEAEVLVDGLVLVYFWAPWCGPHRMVEPILREASATYASHLKFCLLNIDENKKTIARYEIKSVPALLLFQDRAPIKRRVGPLPRVALRKMITNLPNS